MEIILYGNGSSGNHGCEAIVRGTFEELSKYSYLVLSEQPMEDKKYGLDQSVKIEEAKLPVKYGRKFMSAYLKLKLKKDCVPMDCLPYLQQIDALSKDHKIAFSTGGDNYCYNDNGKYSYLNDYYHKRGIKTVLWGCSIEPKTVAQEGVKKDLASYSMIVARESITWNVVKKVNKNAYLAPDPAFYMTPKKTDLNPIFFQNKVIGINISPMIISNESTPGITLKSYEYLIRKILETTDYSIALIPHVVWHSNDDREPIAELASLFPDCGRLIQVGDYTAPELKYIIGKCHMFIGARTHSTIAAYSQCVPTLTIGYSVKARGIAQDLFGRVDDFVLPVQSIAKESDLFEKFQVLLKEEDEIRNHLEAFIPEYLSKGLETVGEVEEYLEALA